MAILYYILISDDYLNLSAALTITSSRPIERIASIFMVSVTERTREIGIRKSLGAKTSSIMMQFLAEAAILTVIGGLIGIVLGVIGGYAICSIISSSMEMTITPGISLKTILAATLFSCAVGVFFGIYPAKKAAKLSPIEALRRN